MGRKLPCSVIYQQTYAQPDLCAKLTEWFNATAPGFLHTSIQCNKNYSVALHIDGNNCGPSAIMSMGDHTGGEIWVWDDEGTVNVKATKSIDGWCKKGDVVKGTLLVIRDTLTISDGRRPHCVMLYTGERYSLVYFVHNSGVTLDKVAGLELRKLKFRKPNAWPCCKQGAVYTSLSSLRALMLPCRSDWCCHQNPTVELRRTPTQPSLRMMCGQWV